MYMTMLYNWREIPKIEVVNQEEWDSLNYFFGEKTENSSSLNIKFKSYSKTELCDIVSFESCIMITEKVKKLLSNYKSVECEFIPIKIIRNLKIHIYYILNVLTLCDCVDFKNSILDISYGEITRVEKLCIKYSKTRDLPFFLIAKSAVQLICFNQDVVNELNHSECTGYKLIPIEDYSYLSLFEQTNHGDRW